MVETGSPFTLHPRNYSILTQHKTVNSVNILSSGVDGYFPAIFLSDSVLSTVAVITVLFHGNFVNGMLLHLKFLLYANGHAMTSPVGTKILDKFLL